MHIHIYIGLTLSFLFFYLALPNCRLLTSFRSFVQLALALPLALGASTARVSSALSLLMMAEAALVWLPRAIAAGLALVSIVQVEIELFKGICFIV